MVVFIFFISPFILQQMRSRSGIATPPPTLFNINELACPGVVLHGDFPPPEQAALVDT
jgi:hypothetical protein